VQYYSSLGLSRFGLCVDLCACVYEMDAPGIGGKAAIAVSYWSCSPANSLCFALYTHSSDLVCIKHRSNCEWSYACVREIVGIGVRSSAGAKDEAYIFKGRGCSICFTALFLALASCDGIFVSAAQAFAYS
jgi:hypothetical protein